MSLGKRSLPELVPTRVGPVWDSGSPLVNLRFTSGSRMFYFWFTSVSSPFDCADIGYLLCQWFTSSSLLPCFILGRLWFTLCSFRSTFAHRPFTSISRLAHMVSPMVRRSFTSFPSPVHLGASRLASRPPLVYLWYTSRSHSDCLWLTRHPLVYLLFHALCHLWLTGGLPQFQCCSSISGLHPLQRGFDICSTLAHPGSPLNSGRYWRTSGSVFAYVWLFFASPLAYPRFMLHPPSVNLDLPWFPPWRTSSSMVAHLCFICLHHICKTLSCRCASFRANTRVGIFLVHLSFPSLSLICSPF